MNLLIALFLVPSFAVAPEGALTRALAECSKTDNVVIEPMKNEDPDDFEDRIAALQMEKEENCKALKEELAAQERALRRFDEIISKLTSKALFSSIEKADALVNLNLNNLDKSLQDMQAVSNEGSSENSTALRALDARLSSQRTENAKLERNWDQIHDMSHEGPVHDLIKLKDDRGLPANAAGSIDTYINALPPYLLGRERAPREKLDFLGEQLRLSLVVARHKNADYTAPARKEIGQGLHASLSADVQEARAGTLKSELIARFGPDTPLWASQFALNQGACSVGREAMQEQIEVLQKALDLADLSFRAPLTAQLAPEINKRKATIQQMRCHSETDFGHLNSSLEQQEARLAACGSKFEITRDDALGLRNDIISWRRETGANRSAEEQKAFQSLGERIWKAAFNILQDCRTESRR